MLNQEVTLLTCTQEAPSSNVSQDNDYPELRNFLLFLSPSTHMSGCHLNLGHDLFFPHPFQHTIHYRPIT
jgi:hypothetical protein